MPGRMAHKDISQLRGPGPQAQKEQRPKGEEKHFKKWPGPQAQREQRPEGEEKHFEKRPGPQAQREQCPEGKEKHFKKRPGPQAQENISQLRKARAAGPGKNNAWRAKKAGPHGPKN